MTSEEIKARYSMKEILSRYGIQQNRNGFITCPFHKEKTASMKIYKDSYYCFGCGKSGDIFSFVQEMDKLDFKEAFQLLGGTYKDSFTARFKVNKAQKERDKAIAKIEKEKAHIRLTNTLITIYQNWVELSEPLSDTWSECYNKLQYQIYLQEHLTEKR